MKRKDWLVWGVAGLVAVVYFGLRLANYPEMMTYHLDQGLHLSESWEMVKSGKIRLIGPMVSSKTFADRGFFIGPQYYYFLAILGIIFRWDPLKISLFTVLIEAGVWFVFVWWIKKRIGKWQALAVALLVTISPYLIIHSRFFWNPHLMLWLSLLVVPIFDNWLRDGKGKWLLLVGILWGIAFGCHYAAALWAIPIGIGMLSKIKKINWKWLLIGLGFLIGNFPYIVFELRHSFYNLRTLWWVMKNSSGSSRMEAHYLINPVLGFVLAGTTRGWKKLGKIKWWWVAGIILLVSWGQKFIYRNERIPLGHPEEWTYPTEIKVKSLILKKGCPDKYNIASTVSGDTRAYDLRFLLTAEDCPPMGVEEYPKAERLFLVALPERKPEEEKVWEVSSLGKFRVVYEEKINERVIFYELVKE